MGDDEMANEHCGYVARASQPAEPRTAGTAADALHSGPTTLTSEPSSSSAAAEVFPLLEQLIGEAGRRELQGVRSGFSAAKALADALPFVMSSLGVHPELAAILAAVASATPTATVCAGVYWHLLGSVGVVPPPSAPQLAREVPLAYVALHMRVRTYADEAFRLIERLLSVALVSSLCLTPFPPSAEALRAALARSAVALVSHALSGQVLAEAALEKRATIVLGELCAGWLRQLQEHKELATVNAMRRSTVLAAKQRTELAQIVVAADSGLARQPLAGGPRPSGAAALPLPVLGRKAAIAIKRSSSDTAFDSEYSWGGAVGGGGPIAVNHGDAASVGGAGASAASRSIELMIAALSAAESCLKPQYALTCRCQVVPPAVWSAQLARVLAGSATYLVRQRERPQRVVRNLLAPSPLVAAYTQALAGPLRAGAGGSVRKFAARRDDDGRAADASAAGGGSSGASGGRGASAEPVAISKVDRVRLLHRGVRPRAQANVGATLGAHGAHPGVPPPPATHAWAAPISAAHAASLRVAKAKRPDASAAQRLQLRPTIAAARSCGGIVAPRPAEQVVAFGNLTTLPPQRQQQPRPSGPDAAADVDVDAPPLTGPSSHSTARACERALVGTPAGAPASAREVAALSALPRTWTGLAVLGPNAADRRCAPGGARSLPVRLSAPDLHCVVGSGSYVAPASARYGPPVDVSDLSAAYERAKHEAKADARRGAKLHDFETGRRQALEAEVWRGDGGETGGGLVERLAEHIVSKRPGEFVVRVSDLATFVSP